MEHSSINSIHTGFATELLYIPESMPPVSCNCHRAPPATEHYYPPITTAFFLVFIIRHAFHTAIAT